MVSTIQVKYSCPACGLIRRTVTVAARQKDEDVVAWMDKTTRSVWVDHWNHSPHCSVKELKELLIPIQDDKPIGSQVQPRPN